MDAEVLPIGDGTLKRLGHLLGVGLLLGAVVLAVLLAVPGLLGAEASYVVYSDSMSPSIEAGDVVVVQSVDPSTLQTGDVITFTTNSGAESTRITHRIVSIESAGDGRQFVTRGDANEQPDPTPVDASQIVGTVWVTIPLVGNLVAFAGTDAGIVVLVIVPAVLFVFNEVYALYAQATPGESAEEGDGE